MRLYDIEETDIQDTLASFSPEDFQEGKAIVVKDMRPKYKYPIKVVARMEGDALLVITAYPFIKGRRGGN